MEIECVTLSKVIDEDGKSEILDREEEEKLIMMCQNGNRDAFRPLVEKHSKPIFVFILRLVGNKEDAKEIAQESFARAFKNIIHFNFGYRFSTWIYSIALNLCRDHVKKKQREKNTAEFFALYQNQNCKYNEWIEDVVDLQIEKEMLKSCLMLLKFKDRELIVLKDIMEMSYQEMKKLTNSNIPVLKMRVMRARRKLLNIIKKYKGENK